MCRCRWEEMRGCDCGGAQGGMWGSPQSYRWSMKWLRWAACPMYADSVSFLSRVNSSSWILLPCIYWTCSQHIQGELCSQIQAIGPTYETGRITLAWSQPWKPQQRTNPIHHAAIRQHFHVQVILMMRIMEHRRGVWTHKEGLHQILKRKPDSI